MNKILLISVFSLISYFNVITADGKLWALLIAGGYDFYSYHNQADVCNMYQILHANGVPDENIIVMMTDDIAFNKLNPNPGEIHQRPDGPNVYENVPTDYVGKNFVIDNLYNVLLGNKSAVTGSDKILNSGPDDYILIYISTYGLKYSLLLSEGFENNIYPKRFIPKLLQMRKQRQFKKMLVLADIPYGETFFRRLPHNTNILAITSTSASQNNEYCNYDKSLHTYHTTCFSSVWMNLLQNVGTSNEQELETLFDYFQETGARWNTSPSIMGDLENVGSTNVMKFFSSKH